MMSSLRFTLCCLKKDKCYNFDKLLVYYIKGLNELNH